MRPPVVHSRQEARFKVRPARKTDSTGGRKEKDMGLFKKNKELLQDIVYRGDNTTFVWRSEIEDFSMGSSLTVGPSQEALFINNGEALDLFPSGRYTLDNSNLPLLRRLNERLFGGKTPFHCSVYFINLVDQMAIKWGTTEKIEYIDPNYNFPVKLGMNGDMTLSVIDSRKLFLKQVGNEQGLTQDQFVSKFRGILMSRIKPYIATYMRTNRVNIFEIDEELHEFSEALQDKLAPEFAEYGVLLNRFVVSGIVKPEDDPEYQKFRAIHYRKVNEIEEAKLEQEKELIAAQTEAGKMDITSEALARKRQREGYTYQQEQGFEVAKTAAANEGAGQFTGMGIGLGAMAGLGGAIGGTVGNTVGGVMSGMQQAAAQPAEQETPQADPMTVLAQLKQLLDNGLIPQEMYDAKVKEVLGRM